MIHINYNDRDFIAHAAERMQDQIYLGNDYAGTDQAACDKLTKLGAGGAAMVLTGDVLTSDEATELLKQVVLAEMEHWVPNASQRLIRRARLALGFPGEYAMQPDCGSSLGNHAFIAHWIAGMYVERCASCHRLFAL